MHKEDVKQIQNDISFSQENPVEFCKIADTVVLTTWVIRFRKRLTLRRSSVVDRRSEGESDDRYACFGTGNLSSQDRHTYSTTTARGATNSAGIILMHILGNVGCYLSGLPAILHHGKSSNVLQYGSSPRNCFHSSGVRLRVNLGFTTAIRSSGHQSKISTI